jgi:hypothetical protein
MSFPPYHAFASCGALERRIEAARLAGNVPDPVYRAYEKYHFSILHKLRSARYHVDGLAGYLSSGGVLAVAPNDLVYRVNFHFDGFLHVVGSASDIFAREVLTYFGVPLPQKVYYHTAEAELTLARPNDPFLARVAAPTWRTEFSNYRNTATHESLIGTRYNHVTDMQGQRATTRVVFPIPDDPRAANHTYRRNEDIVEYCSTTFTRVLSHFNRAYTDLAVRIQQNGSLPL